MIFCNPSNPTGAVAGKKDLDEMVAVLQDFPKVRGRSEVVKS